MGLLNYFTGLAIFFVLLSMLLMLPRQVSILRALETELQLVDLCDEGDSPACQRLTASHDLAARVAGETSSVEGACLYVSEHGLAVKTRSGRVSDLSLKAAAIYAGPSDAISA
jgi:hypothetical protein